MNTEEKARKYDEALNWMRELYPGLHGATKEDAEHFFPELTESEDENLKNKSGYYKAGKFWKASTLWNATKDKIPQRVSNIYILQECTWNIGTLQQFANEVKNVQEVSLDYPIILDMNGNIIDGAHRVVKAYLEGNDIDIVYLGDNEWPEPDYDEEKAVKESDDERMIEEIIHTVTGNHPTHSTMEINKMVAYLEKQRVEEKYDRMQPIYDDRDSFESALEKAWKSYNESASRRVDSFEDNYIECVHAKGFREGYLYGIQQTPVLTDDDKKYIPFELDFLCNDVVAGRPISINRKGAVKIRAWLVDVKECLEKQKDASKAISAVERIDKYIDEHLANAHDMKDSNPDKKYYRGWDDALGKMAGILQDVYSEKENKFIPRVLPCSAAWFEDCDEKQKEHQYCPDAPKEKSVGSVFYPSDKDKNLDEIAQDYVDSVKQYNQEPTWDLMQTAVCYGYHLSEEQFEKNRLANCDALSKEEYDRETDFAMEIIEKEHRHPTFNDAINYGMRLQKQKEQKPAEWSEEDEKMIERLIRHTQKEFDELCNDRYGHQEIISDLKESCRERLNWLENKLKSLRPSWKPSKEQMKALCSELPVMKGGGDKVQVILETLYNDLKKLGVKEDPEYYQHFDSDC